MFRKIITYLLILSVIIPVLAPAGVSGLNTTYAQEQNQNNNSGDVVNNGQSSSNGKINEPCGWTLGIAGGTTGECIGFIFVNIAVRWILPTAVFFTNLVANLFNASIEFSLSGHIFDTEKNIMLATGWTMVRDLVNLVFIFVFLYLAISIILQYGGASVKKVLPSIIIAAVLVNFSMMITKMVIDASHVFAWEFYNQIDVQNEEGLGDGQKVGNLKNDIGIVGDFKRKNLGNVFMAGFNPQNILTGDKNESVKSVLQKAQTEGENAGESWWTLVLPVLLEAALAILAAFVLFAGAIMFVSRVVVLWLVMMFSPIMILGTVLPSMKKYSGMWWSYLIGQSFFAPAFLFMFVLVTKLINSDFLKSIMQTTENSDLKLAFGLNAGSILVPFFHFFVVGGLMVASLIVARQLGGKTASVSIGWAHTARGWAQGAAGKTVKYGAGKPVGYGVGWGLDRFAGKIDTGKGAFSQSLRALPGLGGWARNRSIDIRKRMSEAEKAIGGYNEQETKDILQAPEKAAPGIKQMAQFVRGVKKTFAPDARVAAVQRMAKEGYKTEGLEEDIIKTKERLAYYGDRTKDIDRARLDLVEGNADEYIAELRKKEKDLREKMDKDPGIAEYKKDYDDFINKKIVLESGAETTYSELKKNDAEFRKYAYEEATEKARIKVARKMTGADVEKAVEKLFTDPKLRNILIRSWGSGQMGKVIDRGGEAMDSMFEHLAELGNSFEEVAKNVEKIYGNKPMASFVKSMLGINTINTYGEDRPDAIPAKASKYSARKSGEKWVVLTKSKKGKKT